MMPPPSPAAKALLAPMARRIGLLTTCWRPATISLRRLDCSSDRAGAGSGVRIQTSIRAEAKNVMASTVATVMAEKSCAIQPPRLKAPTSATV